MEVEDALPPRITQDDQVVIILASQYLQACGQRYLIEFGWGNALATAEALGWDTTTLPWPLYKAVWLRDPMTAEIVEEAWTAQGLWL